MKRHSRGYGLVELLLVLGAIAVGSATIYGFYRVVLSQHQENQALSQIRDTIGRVSTAYLSTANYAGLTQERAIEDGLFGKSVTIEQGRAIGSWGGEIGVAPMPTTLPSGQTVPNGAFGLTLEAVPGWLCSQVTSALANARPRLLINGQSIGFDTNGLVDIGALTQQCSANPTSTITLVFDKPNASDSLQRCLLPSGAQKRTVPCGDGQAGTREEERTASCPQAYGDVQWGSWQETGNSCTSCPSPETQITACGPGEFGERQEQRSFDCSHNQWNPWTVQRSTCQPCPTVDEERIAACPAGQRGQLIQRRTFICTQGEWGQWQTQDNQCQP